MKQRWVIYLTERFPLIPNLLVAVGIVLSARVISTDLRTGLLPVFIALCGGMVFLAQIRFMDELKDFEKDKIAHPERPLPRGLFTVGEFSRFVRIFNGIMLLMALGAGVLVSPLAGVYFGVGAIYLFLMFKEFYVGDWLQNRPLVYAITHQLIIFPMCAFVAECFQNDSVFQSNHFYFSALLLFSFFGFEVGRKLDPRAHPVLNTYLSRYGRHKTALLLLVLLGIGLKMGEALGLMVLLGPTYILIITLLSLLWWAPLRFRWIEGFVSVFLLLSVWGLPFVRGLK